MSARHRPIVITTDCTDVPAQAVNAFSELEEQLSNHGTVVGRAMVDKYIDISSQGLAEADERVASFYVHGEGVTANYELALEYLKKSIKKGNGLAYQDLGTLFVMSYLEGPQSPHKLQQAETAGERLFSFVEGHPELTDKWPEYIASKLGETVALLVFIGRPPSSRGILTAMKSNMVHKLSEKRHEYKGTDGEKNYVEVLQYIDGAI